MAIVWSPSETSSRHTMLGRPDGGGIRRGQPCRSWERHPSRGLPRPSAVRSVRYGGTNSASKRADWLPQGLSAWPSKSAQDANDADPKLSGTGGQTHEILQAVSFDTDSTNRQVDRVLATLGLLEDAAPVFQTSIDAPDAACCWPSPLCSTAGSSTSLAMLQRRDKRGGSLEPPQVEHFCPAVEAMCTAASARRSTGYARPS